MMTKYDKLVRQIIFFGVVGAVTLIIDVAVTTSLYKLLNFPAFWASSIGFLSGFIFNFPMNRRRVFHHSDKDRFSLRAQIVMYACLSLFNLVATSSLVHALVSLEILRIEYSKIFVTALIAIWNFILFKLLIFSKKS